jgi:excisionase family DNA binding protein
MPDATPINPQPEADAQLRQHFDGIVDIVARARSASASAPTAPKSTDVAEVVRERLRERAGGRLALSVQDVAQLLGLPLSNLDRSLRAGEVPFIQVGRKRRIAVAVVEQLLLGKGATMKPLH